MRTYKTAVTKPIPKNARFSTRKGIKCVTAVIKGKKITGQVTDKGRMKIEADYYSLSFKDNSDVPRYIRAYNNQSDSKELGRTIIKLMEPGGSIDLAEKLPARIKSKLIVFGIVSERFITQSLKEMIDKYSEWLKSTRVSRHGQNRCTRYCSGTINTIVRIFDGCGFKRYSDINKMAVDMFLGKLKVGKQKVKSATYNQYVIAIKGFCSWAVDNELASQNKVAKLKHINTDDKQIRRAFTTEEVFRLLETAQAAPRRFELNGDQRAAMYLIGVQTGLRKAEILQLGVTSFDLDRGIVRLPKESTKNRKKMELPIRQNLIALIRRYLIKYPGPKLFDRDESFRAAEMIAADLKAAGIPLETDEGIACFHSLRHSYSTNLDETSASWIQVKALMRHTLKTDITARYTKTTTIEKLRPIVEQLPDFEGFEQHQKTKAG